MKTKIGISASFVAALTYFVALYSGLGVALMLIVGYVLLVEDNEWLRKSALKAAVIVVCFFVVKTVIGYIPDAIGLIDDLLGIFGGNFSISFVSNLVRFIDSALEIIESLLLIGLGITALSKKTIKVPVVDGMVDDYSKGE